MAPFWLTYGPMRNDSSFTVLMTPMRLTSLHIQFGHFWGDFITQKKSSKIYL